MKRLENWSVIGNNPYAPPECQTLHLHGNVFGHERHADGKSVRTSAIVGREGELIRTHSGSLYKLGEINPDYESIYSNAKKRLLARLPNALRKVEVIQ